MDQQKNAIQILMKYQKERVYYIKTMNAQRNQALAYICRHIGYNSYQDEKEREKAWKLAKKIFKSFKKDKKVSGEHKELKQTVTKVCINAQIGLAAYQAERLKIERTMSQLVRQLSISKWWCKEKGRSELGLAIIVGEAGDISDYANPAKLWKRFGVAVIDGVAQGKLKKDAPKELWIKHGYNPQRRAVLWTIGDCLIKINKGRYRKIYDARKKYEEKRVDKQNIAHLRAQRYMEKMLLKDLWNQWNRGPMGKYEPCVA